MTDAPRSDEPGRRSLLIMLAAFAALSVVVVGASLVAGAWAKPRPASSGAVVAPDPRVMAFLGPLASGAAFGGWRVTRVDPSQRNSITLDLESDKGERVTVDVHARSASAPSPIAETSSFAIYVRSGRGGAVTSELALRACDALADALDEREKAGQTPPTLAPLAPAEPPPI